MRRLRAFGDELQALVQRAKGAMKLHVVLDRVATVHPRACTQAR
jgi:hypothetical protein